MVIRQNNIYFELFDKYFDSFPVNFACNFTYKFSSVVYKLISGLPVMYPYLEISSFYKNRPRIDKSRKSNEETK